MSKNDKAVLLATIAVGLMLLSVISVFAAQGQMVSTDAAIPVTGDHANGAKPCCVKGHGWMHPALDLSAQYTGPALWDWLIR